MALLSFSILRYQVPRYFYWSRYGCANFLPFSVNSITIYPSRSMNSSPLKCIDIGANLVDEMYHGIYNGKKKHSPDLEHVLQRAYTVGIDKIIITGTNLETSRKALELANTDDRLYVTVGCHPTHCDEFEKSGNSEEYLHELEELILSNSNKVVAVGECGLDYDRLHFCSKEIQQKYFERQLKLSKELNLPLFLHCRNAATDFINCIQKQNYTFDGVVHSFDGSAETLHVLLDMGFYIGINGCSLKTESNLETMKLIPTDKLLIESDCPWCEVRPSHAGYKYIKTTYPSVKKEKWVEDHIVKSRNEPCNTIQILEIVSAVRGENLEELSELIYNNTKNLFRKISL